MKIITINRFVLLFFIILIIMTVNTPQMETHADYIVLPPDTDIIPEFPFQIEWINTTMYPSGGGSISSPRPCIYLQSMNTYVGIFGNVYNLDNNLKGDYITIKIHFLLNNSIKIYAKAFPSNITSLVEFHLVTYDEIWFESGGYELTIDVSYYIDEDTVITEFETSTITVTETQTIAETITEMETNTETITNTEVNTQTEYITETEQITNTQVEYITNINEVTNMHNETIIEVETDYYTKTNVVTDHRIETKERTVTDERISVFLVLMLTVSTGFNIVSRIKKTTAKIPKSGICGSCGETNKFGSKWCIECGIKI